MKKNNYGTNNNDFLIQIQIKKLKKRTLQGSLHGQHPLEESIPGCWTQQWSWKHKQCLGCRIRAARVAQRPAFFIVLIFFFVLLCLKLYFSGFEYFIISKMNFILLLFFPFFCHMTCHIRFPLNYLVEIWWRVFIKKNYNPTLKNYKIENLRKMAVTQNSKTFLYLTLYFFLFPRSI